MSAILLRDDAGVRILTLNRPDKRNALTGAMYDALATALTEADRDDAIGAVLIHGAGTMFTAGNDLADFLAVPPTTEDSPVFRFLFALTGFSKPIVAAVQGAAVGIGTTMLLHCDLVLAAPDARLHLPFIDLGLVPEAASSLLLPARIGHARAAAMLMLGQPLEAETAVAQGLVNQIVPAEQLLAVAGKVAQTLAAKPRQAMRHTKALMRGNVGAVNDTIRREGVLFGQMLRSPEAKATFQAFLDKSKK